MKTKKLVELAKTIRSKNAGTDKITFDIIFREKKNYELIKKSQVLTKRTVAKLFNIPEERISDFVEFDPAYAIKFTIYRIHPSGSPGETDVFGCQQYPPLLDLEIPVETKGSSTSRGGKRPSHRVGRLRSSTSRTTLSKRRRKR
jgi:Domain of unknown function (DUF4387)